MSALARDIAQCLSGEATYLVQLENEIKMMNGYESNPLQNKDKRASPYFGKKAETVNLWVKISFVIILVIFVVWFSLH